ncbi:uncharacterized protein BO95DRAFT_447278 [Aspergillus brunneoviolaceus CBS 621.78]|uniref:Uncharacterized protein n=1 Tax=Aspergillus brunneoviolaceus CBS 621.78 TaxID=1450534 RepID=A0ACD1FVT3_9EURO|nr:hypothetical protein BO95DRAFT_447278 [Aspergillus brunneoviolaceus CBS 621.78]RAH41091.1 hypothetical protein BO95DRAFT_447278 [Aspergillus brunneoviolaceus CBS 621.78]
MAFPANGTQLREDDGPAGTTDPAPPADAQPQPQLLSHPQGPPQPQSSEELRAFQTQLMALEAENRRRLTKRRLAERQAQQQQQQAEQEKQQAEQHQDQHQEELEQSSQPQQPVQQIYPHHGPCGMSQLQSQLQDFRLQQALLERQRQMILARLAEQQQQEQGQHGDPNVPGSPAVKEEESVGDVANRKVPVHVLQDYQLGLTLQHRRVQLQSTYRQSRIEHLLARQESMEDSYAQLLLWRLERPSPRTEDEAEILTDLKRLLEAGLGAIQGAMQEPPTVELTDEDRQLDLQLIQLNRLRYAVRDQHIAEGLVEPDEGIRRTMNTRLSSQERFEDLRLHLDRRLA